MGAVVSGLGSALGGLAGQTNYQSGQANITQPVTSTQATDAVTQQQNLINALQAQNGIGNQNSVYGQQQSLANQLGAMAQGQGPNPALDQLNQTTAANTANQAALMAGQRGAGSNAGLIARQAAQQGAANQQNAIGQAATMRANQQLGAISALQQQQGMLGNTAASQVNNLQNATTNQQNTLLNQANTQNNQSMQNYFQQQGINAGIAQNNANNLGQITQAGIKAAGSALTSAASPAAAAANGGDVESLPILKENYSGPKSKVSRHLFAKGGEVPAMVAPGEIYLSPEKAAAVKAGKASPLSGEKIQGKAPVEGAVNSYANDIIPKTLEIGGIVLPNSVTKSSNPEEKAHKFIEAIKKKKGK